jgi:superoxide dismutase
MPFNDHKSEYSSDHHTKKVDILDLKMNDALLAQSKLLTSIMEELTKRIAKIPQQLKSMQEGQSKQVMKYELLAGPHQTRHCLPKEEVNYVKNQYRYN